MVHKILSKASCISHDLILSLLARSKWQSLRRCYWDIRAREIDEKWGAGETDFQVLDSLINALRPGRILDIGCGSGRCFPLYTRLDIPEVVAQDVSSEALSIARQRYPEFKHPLLNYDICKLNYPIDHFDLILSTRVLSAVLPDRISQTISALCRMGKRIYVNEVTDSDDCGSLVYWFKHDYDSMMRSNHFSIEQVGTIKVEEDNRVHIQTWKLFRKD